MKIIGVVNLLSSIFDAFDYVGKTEKNAVQFCCKGFHDGLTVIDQVCDIIVLCQNV